jgi:Flp pilus assembly protein TadB
MAVGALGAMLAAVAAAALVLSVRSPSRVAAQLARFAQVASVSPRRSIGRTAMDLRHSGLGWTVRGLARVRFALAVGLASLGWTVAGPLAGVLAGYVGFIGPSLVVERLASRRRRVSEDACGGLIERVEALVASGRPPEQAFVVVASRRSGAVLLDGALATAVSAYTLGAPLFPCLGAAARDNGVARLAALAEELERARDLGRASSLAIRDARESARAAERARALEVAGQVESRLMLVLVLCYMPALMLAVVIPLFLGLLAGLFG